MVTKAANIKNQMSSESVEWYTPCDVLHRAIRAMGSIDLDPCSEPGCNVPATRHITAEDDGLAHPWIGNVFMNPPYAGATLNWCRHLIKNDPLQSITLVAANTDTRYFHEMLAYADVVCFVKGRLEFTPGPGNMSSRSTVRNVLFYRGHKIRAFQNEFKTLGSVIIL